MSMQQTPEQCTTHHGCCVDKACTDRTCMALPQGKTCGDCVHERRCCLIFGHTPTDTYCGWFPRRFHEAAIAKAGGAALACATTWLIALLVCLLVGASWLLDGSTESDLAASGAQDLNDAIQTAGAVSKGNE